MHFRPEELRAVRRGDLVVRYAPFGDVTFALATLPLHGARGTALAEPCVAPHWGFVLQGSLGLERGGKRRRLPAGSAFYIEPGEPPHRFTSRRPALVAGFVPTTPTAGAQATAERDGFEPIAPGPSPNPAALTVSGFMGARSVHAEEGEIRTDAGVMGPWLFVQASFGSTSGFTGGWCDLPHWGIVLEGGLTIEWEDDVEVLSRGDVYCCPAGPPGHRFEVADSATVFDFTPLDGITEPRRVAVWRPVGCTRGRVRPHARLSGSGRGRPSRPARSGLAVATPPQ